MWLGSKTGVPDDVAGPAPGRYATKCTPRKGACCMYQQLRDSVPHSIEVYCRRLDRSWFRTPVSCPPWTPNCQGTPTAKRKRPSLPKSAIHRPPHPAWTAAFGRRTIVGAESNRPAVVPFIIDRSDPRPPSAIRRQPSWRCCRQCEPGNGPVCRDTSSGQVRVKGRSPLVEHKSPWRCPCIVDGRRMKNV